MSVDLAAELAAPISLAAVVKGAREVLGALLGLGSEAPELEIIDGWQVANRLRVSSGRPMSAEECAGMLIGGRIPACEGESAGSLTFEVGLVGVRTAPT
ncbi:hypothetical protein OHV05_34885 [Kitasatospora sp. NBC_00070]|uniref:hypothetical protein n=1 Tax=Kitasatospora sp. NBC_00070 TaxID=2975962 RepID=UPI003254AEA3